MLFDPGGRIVAKMGPRGSIRMLFALLMKNDETGAGTTLSLAIVAFRLGVEVVGPSGDNGSSEHFSNLAATSMHKHSSLALIATLSATVAFADSGPAAGKAVPALKVDAVAGPMTGETKDFAAERKDKPTIYIFVQAEPFGRPTARFLKVLDQELGKDRPDVQIIAVWLTDDVAKSKEYLPKAQMSLQLGQTVWAVYPGDKTGPADWGIDVGVQVTAIVADGAKVVKSFDYNSVNDTVVPDVLKKLPAKK
jgi:hypothetical protein